MTGRMSKRQGLILVALVVIAVCEAAKLVHPASWRDLLSVVPFCTLLSAAAGAVVGFLLKSDGHTTPESSDAARPPAE